MSNNTITSQDERAKRKALLVAKIYAERELICLQAHRIANDVKPSTIKSNLVESAVERLQGTKTSRRFFAYMDRHPKVSWAVSQLLLRGVQSASSSRSSIWRPLILGAASCFVSGRKNSANRVGADRRESMQGTRIRAQSKPIRFAADEFEEDAASSRPASGRSGRAAQGQRAKRRVARRHRV